MNLSQLCDVLQSLYPGLVFTIQRDFETDDPYDHLIIHPDEEQLPEYQGMEKPSREYLESQL